MIIFTTFFVIKLWRWAKLKISMPRRWKRFSWRFESSLRQIGCINVTWPSETRIIFWCHSLVFLCFEKFSHSASMVTGWRISWIVLLDVSSVSVDDALLFDKSRIGDVDSVGLGIMNVFEKAKSRNCRTSSNGFQSSVSEGSADATRRFLVLISRLRGDKSWWQRISSSVLIFASVTSLILRRLSHRCIFLYFPIPPDFLHFPSFFSSSSFPFPFSLLNSYISLPLSKWSLKQTCCV